MISDIYKDPLTGMNNFFGLMNCDIEDICCNKGTIAYMDLKCLSAFNDTLGMHAGDEYIRTLANSIERVINQLKEKADIVHSYRVSGDEFLIIVPNHIDIDLKEHFELIDKQLRDYLLQYGLSDGGIWAYIWSYHEPIGSVAQLLKTSSLFIERVRGKIEVPIELPCWADDLINKMLYKVNETLNLLKQANYLALQDEISALPNQRAARMYLDEVMSEYQLFTHPFSILFIDGDNLKKYNSLGYQYGNQMIKDLGKIVTEAIRHDDMVFRWLSGDEFVVILKQTSQDLALTLGERARSQVEKVTGEWKYPITISIGVSTCPVNGTTVDEVIAAAEHANMLAKQAGKNCVVSPVRG